VPGPVLSVSSLLVTTTSASKFASSVIAARL
jgi:hypothetical protein